MFKTLIFICLITPLFANEMKTNNDNNKETATIENSIEKTDSAKIVDNVEKKEEIVDNNKKSEEKTNDESENKVVEENTDSGLKETAEKESDEDKAEDDDLEDDEQLKIKSEEEKKKDLWLEKLTGKHLVSLKERLESLKQLYETNYEAFKIGEAINSVEKAENSQKRNFKLIQDLTKQYTFDIYASSYIFPELLKLNIQKFNTNSLGLEKTLTDEIAETQEEIDDYIKNLSQKVSDYKKLKQLYEKVVLKAQNSLDNLIKTNNKTNNLTKTGYFIKNTNQPILHVINEQVDSMSEIANQLDLAIEYSEKQLDFVNKHNLNISNIGKYIAEIRSSFKAIENHIESYEYRQNYNFYELSKLYETRYSEIEKMIGSEEVREGRIKAFIKAGKFSSFSQKIAKFDLIEEFNEAFELLGFSEVDTELYEQLLPYMTYNYFPSGMTK